MKNPISYLAQVSIREDQIQIPKNLVSDSSSFAGILQVVFGLIGSLAVLMVVYGGLKYVISQGDPQATAKAKDTILYALIGVAVCVLAFSIVAFVGSRLG